MEKDTTRCLCSCVCGSCENKCEEYLGDASDINNLRAWAEKQERCKEEMERKCR